MNLYAHDLSVLDFNLNFSDPYGEPFSHLRTSSAISTTALRDYDDDVYRAHLGKRNKQAMRSGSPPKHRHDGSSPLPLGMDWSPPPRKWDGQDSLRPQEPSTGWSYSVTIPSWTSLPKSSGSDPVVFYEIKVELQSPEGIASTRGISRRFNEFLELFSELRRALPKKHLPPAPPKRVLRMKNRTFHEERRSSLEEWMEMLLSDIDVSRSVPVANFLELEAAVRSFFSDVNHQASNEVSSNNFMVILPQTSPTTSIAAVSSIASSPRDDTCDEVKDLELELETTEKCSEQNVQQSILNEKETFTQMQSDMEEFKRKCLDMDVKLEAGWDEKVRTESTKMSSLEENRILLQGFEASRKQLEDLQKQHEDFVTKSKADVKLLIKEVKSLRGTQLDLKQEFSQLMKKKSELEGINVQKRNFSWTRI